MFDLSGFGKHLLVKSKNKYKIDISDKQMFIELIDTFSMAHQRSLNVEKEHGLKLEKYDGLFFLLIENLFYHHYGEWQTELILWYVYDRLDDEENTIPMLLLDELTGEESEIYIENATDLYTFIQGIKRKLKKNKKK
jgi:hypothetical protein